MKRYIKASISPSAPDWLKRALTGRSYGGIKDKLLSKYHIALDRAEFTKEPTGPASIPIYLLQSDYGTEIYCPGANDDHTGYFNGRNRKFGSIAKSKLPEMAVDIVYVNTGDEGNTFSKRDKYEDPRRTYRYNSKQGDYAGQYQHAAYLGRDENGKEMYDDPKWSPAGMTPSNERKARDKSGYKIPSPAQMLTDYYSKFPERVTDKLDNVYEKILNLKDKLVAVDFNGPRGTNYGRDISDAYREFSRVVGDYRSLFEYLDENRQLKGGRSWDADYYIKEFSSKVRNIVSQIKEIEDMLQ